jgi:hypothetical protein
MPKFENTWNWSNVIALGTMAIGGIVAFVSVQAEVSHLNEEVAQVKVLAEKVEIQSANQQAASEARIIQRLDQMQVDIREIRNTQLRKQQ